VIGSELFGTYLEFMLKGVIVTLRLSAGSLFFGCLIGIVFGMGRASSILWLRRPIAVYVEVLRSIPLLILLFVVFYGLPAAFRIRLDPFASGIVSMSIYIGAYMTEVVRAGIEAIPRGQIDASYALGFGYFRMMRIVFPQALRVLLPSAIGLSIASIKDSSLASIIGLTELTRAGLVVRQNTLSNWDVFAFITIFYFVICSAVSIVGYLVEERLRVSDRERGVTPTAGGPGAPPATLDNV
jgi:His/Glu/Gln/Arg/opine family amino acid ABC transporter permease subunit